MVANQKVKAGIELAHYYIKCRKIPKKNLVCLQTSSREVCSREVYDLEIREPLRELLPQYDADRPVRCLVLMYGIPLKIKSEPRRRQKPEEVKKTGKETSEFEKGSRDNTRAAVDSELALLRLDEYPLANWVPNPCFPAFTGPGSGHRDREKILMISRLDGPNPTIVRRLIDDALAAEKRGLTGRAFFDARWPDPIVRKGLSGYQVYDAALHDAAAMVRKSRRLAVVVDAREELFQPGDCPDAALYCGWYSRARYVDAFTWRQGAIAFHIASSECATLKSSQRPLWCLGLLKDGVAATLGPVYEPYTHGFPMPDLFFSHLTYDYLCLAESYLLSLPVLSWQMVLIGDPLYTPFPF